MLDEMLVLVMQHKAMVMDEIARVDWLAAEERMAWFIENNIEVRWNLDSKSPVCIWSGGSVDWVTNDPHGILHLYKMVHHEAKRVPRVKEAATIWAEKQGYVVKAITVLPDRVTVTTTCETPCGAVAITRPLKDGEFDEDTPLDALSVAEANLMAKARRVQSHHETEFVTEQAGVELMHAHRRVAA